jgi:protein-tyrosine phosphatase
MGNDQGVNSRTRLVPLSGAFNFRDLGGYSGRDGRSTRWSMLFRSDTLHELSQPDVDLLRSMGLATIIDLRTSRELERTGRGPLAGYPIGFHHLSVIQEGGRQKGRGEGADGEAGDGEAGDGEAGDGEAGDGEAGDGEAGDGEAMAAPVPPDEDLSERYLWYLQTGASSLVDAITLLGEPSSYPVVFHCAAGKDRTGVLAALVLDILGVAEEVIVDDYVITAARMPMILERYRTDPAFADRMATVPASRFSVEAGTMERFLSGLHERYGGAEAWAVDAGVPAEALDRMESLLLEPIG